MARWAVVGLLHTFSFAMLLLHLDSLVWSFTLSPLSQWGAISARQAHGRSGCNSERFMESSLSAHSLPLICYVLLLVIFWCCTALPAARWQMSTFPRSDAGCHTQPAASLPLRISSDISALPQHLLISRSRSGKWLGRRTHSDER